MKNYSFLCPTIIRLSRENGKHSGRSTRHFVLWTHLKIVEKIFSLPFHSRHPHERILDRKNISSTCFRILPELDSTSGIRRGTPRLISSHDTTMQNDTMFSIRWDGMPLVFQRKIMRSRPGHIHPSPRRKISKPSSDRWNRSVSPMTGREPSIRRIHSTTDGRSGYSRNSLSSDSPMSKIFRSTTVRAVRQVLRMKKSYQIIRVNDVGRKSSVERSDSGFWRLQTTQTVWSMISIPSTGQKG